MQFVLDGDMNELYTWSWINGKGKRDLTEWINRLSASKSTSAHCPWKEPLYIGLITQYLLHYMLLLLSDIQKPDYIAANITFEVGSFIDQLWTASITWLTRGIRRNSMSTRWRSSGLVPATPSMSPIAWLVWSQAIQ